MAAITPNLENPASWLSIELTCQQQVEELELRIKFINTQAETQSFTFSNHARKAELLGLRFINQNGQRVLPTHNLLIKPSQIEELRYILEEGDFLLYTLHGKITVNSMIFPGAVFDLNAKENYQIYFQYAGQKSNSIAFSF